MVKVNQEVSLTISQLEFHGNLVVNFNRVQKRPALSHDKARNTVGKQLHQFSYKD